MAMQQLILPGEIVKKRNEIICTRINISSKTAGRILASLIACIRREDTKFKDAYSVPIKSYLLADERGQTYKLAKAACHELASARIEEEQPNPKEPDGDPILRIKNFFTIIEYSEGIVKAQFNPAMADYLLQLSEVFTQYNLLEYLKLSSIYSQRMFEIIKSHSYKPEEVISMANLHKWLDTPPSFHADFRQFRVHVLEKAHKDIHANTSLRFEWEPVKAGRTVGAIRFIFAPGRKAIAEAVVQKAKDEKKRRLEGRRMRLASECAKFKRGECVTQDNKRLVCKACMHWKMCEDVRRLLER